ncbi:MULTISPECIES: hypothetical protein [Archaeoglobus]|jgi:hypothetical protein|nr:MULTISPECIES: hypothetical protein [Archaeoglobus]AIG98955.1 hypothetical protein AFULGI_00022240 [Archaeoglobus fulgidus DSM 8774]KUJ93795.1 MAG: hypothetical protein XD40_1016 [Archaeoglobus fulgidus]KUK06635.1 MAG: hypothetical protein XD48_1144 [Archaeoglobus fulgidus]MDI3497784.1 hypothetical protein [Archaeoglobus sp.]
MAKLLVLIVSGKEAREKAVAGLVFAANSMKFGWAEKVEIIFFGPSEDLLVEDEEFRNLVLSQLGEYKPLACKFVADMKGYADKLDFTRLEYIGELVNRLIDEGFTPMVF